MAISFDAAVFTRKNSPLSIETVTFHNTVHDKEVVVELVASGVCHSDYHVIKGDWDAPAPMVLGHEGAGRVVEVGKSVTRIKPGDHVVLSWSPACGHCEFCEKGRPVLCKTAKKTAYEHLSYDGNTRLERSSGEAVYSFIGVGTFGKYTVVHEDAAVKVREDVPFAQASLVGCAVTTGIGAVVNTAQMLAGETALVIGCGGVGLNVIQGARLAGAKQIIVSDLSDEKLRLAEKFGATHTVNPSDCSLSDAVWELTNGRGVDYAFEAIGLPKTIEEAYSSTVSGGTTVVVGQVGDNVKVAIDPFVLSDQEKRLIGSNYGSCIASLDFPKIIDLYMAGKIDLDRLITKRITLPEINEAFELMGQRKGIRTVIEY